MHPIVGLLAILAIFAATVAAELPAYRDAYVNDFAGVLDAAQAAELHSLFSGIRETTTAQIVFVSVQTTAPDTPSAVRTRLLNAWGVGDKEKDNGILILYAVKERRIEVEVGYGLEGILPDSKVGRLLDETYVPLRDANRTNEGIVAFSHAAAQVIQDNAEDVRAGKTADEGGLDWFLVMYILLFILIFVISIRRKRGGYAVLPGFGGGWRGGSGGSFGGGGFGGGGSGGGGAGR
ncbi:TPM domain-containing protein [Candidatus Micrarchaeota archaeon]|nr:TPM domain-containing protein [Candidatus Micrarchaeota archaeon]